MVAPPSSSSSPSLSAASDDQTRPPKTLVLCFDGTSNQFDGENTNIVRFFALLKKDPSQMCYYQAGIGTYTDPSIISPALLWFAKILDEAFAWYLDAHVMGGYLFLMQNYHVGDKICLFGFSRGAYTARALAGMLTKVGLLPKDNPEQIPFAYKMYTRTDKAGIELSSGFKQTYSRSVRIEFIGVWETVASVGVIMGKTLPFTSSNTAIKTFRHALSLDEHRAKFRPTLYHRPAPSPEAAANDPEHASPVLSSTAPSNGGGGVGLLSRISSARVDFKRRHSKKSNKADKQKSKEKTKEKKEENADVDVVVLAAMEEGVTVVPDTDAQVRMNIQEELEEEQGPETDVLEVWFAGCHSDVGGGAVPDGTQYSLSDITLRWMVREVVAAQCGVKFDEEALQREGIPTSEFPPLTSRPPTSPTTPPSSAAPEPAPAAPPNTEGQLDATCASQPLHDELSLAPIWWALEIVPLSYSWQDAQGVWHTKWSFHLGRGRRIPDTRPLFHTSVRERIGDASLKYTPKARFTAGSQVYVP